MALAFVFSTRSTGWGYATRMCARQPSHPGLARTAGTSPVATSAGGLDAEQSCDFFQSGTEAMARAMVRREVNVRTASILYTARRVLERRRVFLVCDGISPQMAADLGFAYCTNDFDDALAVALAERGQDASIAVNLVASTDANPPGRPVAWRVMPWREGVGKIER